MRSRSARGFVALAVFAVVVMTTAGIAGAAPANNQQPVPVTSGDVDLGGFEILPPIVLPAPLPLVLTDLQFTAKAKWSGDLTTNVTWDSDDVRQGKDLDVGRTATPSGKIDVSWQISGKVDGIDFGPSTFSKDSINCVPGLSGGGFSCEATSDGLRLPGALPSPVPTTIIFAELGVHVKFDVTPEGAIVTRHMTVGGADVAGPSANPGPLDLVDTPSSETFAMPCTSKAGDAVDYGLSDYRWTPDTTATQQARITIANSGPFGAGTMFEYTHFDIGPTQTSNPAFDVAGTGFLTSMGPLLANNVSPTIDPLGPFTGNEGSPIQFSASVHSQCPIGSYVWEFSNGTKSFGPNPQRTFADDGVYDGQLTVTDLSGLSATQDFTVTVSNLAPTVYAGPDTTQDWGRPVAFIGQAVDPGTADQSTLQYTWDFGDGTPSASGGPNTVHSYAAPNATGYTATLTVCDNDSACTSDSRVVIVTKRDTSTGYLGDTSGTFDTPSTLSASLVDEYGQTVNGRILVFQVAPDAALNGITNSSGIATRSYTPTLSAGAYSATSAFNGDALYNPSGSSNAFAVAKKATTTSYTGAVTGGPNKTIQLSAVVKDATGTPLANRTVQFQLGSQSVSATTNASGIAATSLKLNQKNGTYTVSATFTPVNAAPNPLDGDHYVGSSQSAIFKLQAK